MNTNKNQTQNKCLTVLLWERTSMGARRYEMLFDESGQAVRPFAWRLKGPKYSEVYTVLVEPNKTYYNLYLRLTNIKESPKGPRQNKYGSLEIVTYEEDGLFGEYFDVRWWPKHLANYPHCRKVIISVPWFYTPWDVKKDQEVLHKLPFKLSWIMALFQYKVEYWGDLDALVKDLEIV